MAKKRWVFLGSNPEIQIPLTETHVPNVYATEKIKLLRRGVLMASYDHIRMDEHAKLLFVYDAVEGCDVRNLGPYIPNNFKFKFSRSAQ